MASCRNVGFFATMDHLNTMQVPRDASGHAPLPHTRPCSRYKFPGTPGPRDNPAQRPVDRRIGKIPRVWPGHAAALRHRDEIESERRRSARGPGQFAAPRRAAAAATAVMHEFSWWYPLLRRGQSAIFSDSGPLKAQRSPRPPGGDRETTYLRFRSSMPFDAFSSSRGTMKPWVRTPG